MTIRLTYPRTAAGVAAGIIVIGLFLTGVAYAVTSNVFRYSAPQTGWLSINAAALGPGSDEATFGSDYAAGALIGFGCFQTGVSLPHGARLTALTVWHSDTDISAIQFLLFRHNNNTGAGNYIVNDYNSATTSNRVAKVFPLSGPSAAVNNRVFSYGFAVCFVTGAATFHSARLTYTYTTAGG